MPPPLSALRLRIPSVSERTRAATGSWAACSAASSETIASWYEAFRRRAARGSSSPDAPRAGHVAVSPAHPALGRPPLPERAWLLPGGAGSTQAASNQPTDGRHDCMCARRYLMRRTGAAFVMTRSASAGSSQDRCASGSAHHQ